MEIKLNIYGENKQIAKTYTAEGYDLEMGTIEDFVDIFDVDDLSDKATLVKMVIKGYKQIKPLMKDVFPGLTDEEFRHIRLEHLVEVISELGAAIVENLGIFKQGNSQRA